MPRGRGKKDPAEIQLLEGRTNQDGKINVGPRSPGGIGDCPVSNAKIKEVWERLSSEWHLLLCPQDREAFYRLCRLTVAVDELDAKLDECGDTVINEKGVELLAPWATRHARLIGELFRIYNSFGATPTARTRVSNAATIKGKDAVKMGPASLLTN